MTRVIFVSLLGAIGLSLVVLELVRRRRLQERYSMLWLATCLALIVLAAVPGLLDRISSAVGIIYPPNALFFVAFAFVVLLGTVFPLLYQALNGQQVTRALLRHKFFVHFGRVPLLAHGIRHPAAQLTHRPAGRTAQAAARRRLHDGPRPGRVAVRQDRTVGAFHRYWLRRVAHADPGSPSAEPPSPTPTCARSSGWS